MPYRKGRAASYWPHTARSQSSNSYYAMSKLLVTAYVSLSMVHRKASRPAGFWRMLNMLWGYHALGVSQCFNCLLAAQPIAHFQAMHLNSSRLMTPSSFVSRAAMLLRIVSSSAGRPVASKAAFSSLASRKPL